MPAFSSGWSRRHFLHSATSLLVSAAGGASAGDMPRSLPPPRPQAPRKKLALVTTAYYYLSHAYHLAGRFLHGYLREGKMHYPDFALAGMFVEQHREGDLSKLHSRRYGVPLFSTVDQALTLGGDRLAVDGVLLIGEHGDYPYNEKLQKLYPRYELFQKIVAVFDKSKRSVPVFCDKHLSYDRQLAREMVATARKRSIPLYAGSSLPLTWRRPELELPLGARITEALVVSRGEIEIFGIHALEALQCMVERRTQKEQGVKAVTCLEGEAVWKAADAGKWSWELLEHALGRSPSRNVGNIKDNCRDFTPPPGRPSFLRGPIAFLLEYRDGLRATVLLLNGHVDDTTFAARIDGQKNPVSTLFYLPPPPGAAFLEALSARIEGFLATGQAPTPVERTLLTGSILEVALESRIKKQQRLETPDIQIVYAPPKDSGFFRGDYTAPVGKSAQ